MIVGNCGGDKVDEFVIWKDGGKGRRFSYDVFVDGLGDCCDGDGRWMMEEWERGRGSEFGMEWMGRLGFDKDVGGGCVRLMFVVVLGKFLVC